MYLLPAEVTQLLARPDTVVLTSKHYWWAGYYDEGKWIGYVGSSGLGNQHNRYAAFSIFRPTNKDPVASTLFEFMTNEGMFFSLSKRKYRWVLTALLNILQQQPTKSYDVTYHNRPAKLQIRGDRYLSLFIPGIGKINTKIELWRPDDIRRLS